ncbi:MAG: DUF2752 domain-containing protein [Muribaculaceae bacterium]|nr:DUF2752 domain-containing protein [Muribaculaceae bacterium]
MKLSRTKIVIIGAVGVVLLALYYLFDPSEAGFFPPCPSHLLTGYDCPGCGTQRALHALLHGDLRGFVHYNAMLVVGVPLVLAIAASNMLRRRYPRFHSAMNSNYVIGFAAVLTVFWTVYRNIFPPFC